MNSLGLHLDHLVLIVLMSFRFGAFFMSAPLFGEFKVPVLGRLILPAALAFLIAPHVPVGLAPNLGSSTLAFLFAIVTETLVGILMGFSIHLLFMLASVAGELCGLQVGFSIASMFDPNFGHSAMLAFFMRLFLILLFFQTGMHRTFFWLVAQSYQNVPPGSNFFDLAQILPGLLKLFNAVYFAAFRFCLPVLVTIFLAHVMVGVVSITAPQMNFYFNVAVSLNVVIGMILIALSFSLLFQFFYTGTVSVQDFLGGYFVTR